MNINSNGIIAETRENAISDSIAIEEKKLQDVTKWALYYLSIGWSIFPVKLIWNNDKKKWDKKPFIKWEKYQNELASEEHAIQWFEKQFPYAYIGVATGAKSGIAAIDFELGADSSQFPDTVKSKTASGGNHFIYEHPKKYVTGTIRVLPLTDIRGDGNFIVVPCGRDKYEWVNPPHSMPLAPYPEKLIKRLGSDKRVSIRETIEKKLEVPDGTRNTHYSRFIWKLLHQVEPYLWDEFILPAALEFNRKHCKPPEDEKLVYASYQSAVAAMRSDKEKGQKKSQPLSVADVLNMEVEARQFLVEGLVPESGITTFSGYPSSGKSWVILHVALCVASGNSVFDRFPVQQGAVLIIDEEAGSAEFKRRMTMMEFKPEDKVYLYSQQGFRVDNEDDLQHLVETASNLDVRLVIFDPFSAIHSKTENNAEEMQRVMDALQKFNLAGISVIFIHHHRKEHFMARNTQASIGLRGSTVLFARVDSHVAVKKEKEAEGGIQITVEQAKQRRGKKVKPFQVEVKINAETQSTTFVHLGAVEEGLVKKEEAKERIKEMLQSESPLSTPIIKEQLREAGIGKSNIEEALKEMIRDGEVKDSKITGHGNTKFYVLAGIVENEEIKPADLFESTS